ncbi:cytochrome P450 [Synechocystis sp. PCC 7509]|uniref:cytochrome P450 n=1 Tax=Synechocystis sp. PCC 7509 TaxID=927677 RepID=UPI0002AC546B|nr:cytochrome P450 [Synechocystis sp. PCC 7509]
MKLPDGPKTLPFIQMLQWISNPLEFMDNCSQRYGDCFTVRLANFKPMVFFSNPQAIEQIFTSNLGQFDSGRANSVLQPWVGDKSLLLLDGRSHQRQRKLLTPPFHGDRMKSYGEMICNITEQVISTWQIDKPFSVRSAMQEISLSVILQTVFGLQEGDRTEKLKRLLTSLLDMTSSPLSSSLVFFKALQQDLGAWSPWGRFVRQRAQIDEIIYAEICDRRQHPDSSRVDILSLLMSAIDENGEPMSDVELRDELLTLLVAGHETTASALTWALYWIHHLPEVKSKLLDDLATVGNLDFNAIAKLPYLNAVCQETLRIYPIAMLAFFRIANAPINIMGQEFEPETVLTPCIYLTHHRLDLYPEPNQFKPERFLERQFSKSEYIPFGGSNRLCIGMAFALYEMKLVLATVMSRYSLAISGNQTVKPVRRGITLAPSGGKWLVAKQRHTSRELVSSQKT